MQTPQIDGQLVVMAWILKSLPTVAAVLAAIGGVLFGWRQWAAKQVALERADAREIGRMSALIAAMTDDISDLRQAMEKMGPCFRNDLQTQLAAQEDRMERRLGDLTEELTARMRGHEDSAKTLIQGVETELLRRCDRLGARIATVEGELKEVVSFHGQRLAALERPRPEEA